MLCADRARQGAPGVIDSYCDNQIGGNIDNGTVPNDLCPKLLPTPPAIVTETVTQTVPAPQQCVVPALRGLQVAFARRLLKAAGCALGRVAKKPAKKRKQRDRRPPLTASVRGLAPAGRTTSAAWIRDDGSNEPRPARGREPGGGQ